VTWTVPKSAPQKSFLHVEAERFYKGRFRDDVGYLARLRVVE
jgi:hypothetical protein